MRSTIQSIADKADVDLTLSSGRRRASCPNSLHCYGKAVDISEINGVEVGRGRTANPDALGLVVRVQGVALGMTQVRENLGPLGLFNAPRGGAAQTLRGGVFGEHDEISFFLGKRGPGLWQTHQNHIHLGIW
jgi:hypothetical protein